MKTSFKVCSLVVAFCCSAPQLVNAASNKDRDELAKRYNLVEGKQVYENTCAACHASGVMDAPAFCDLTAWRPRIAKGMETLVNHAVQGFNNMPSKGGLESLTVQQSANAVAYMVEQCLIVDKK